MKPRILLGAESLAPGNGGICRVARLMARVLAGQRQAGMLDAEAVVLSDAVPTDDLGIPVRTTLGSRLEYVARVHRAALDHTHFIYDFQGMSRAHCRLPFLRRPMMTYIHGVEVWETEDPVRARRARRADFLLSNSAYTRERADRAHGGFGRARVCWLATEEDELPQPAPQVHGPPTVLIMGRIDQPRYKGHDELIDCWPQVVAQVPGARLLIVGRGEGLEPLRAKASASPVARLIELAGFVPDPAMPAIWAQTHVFAMPSRYEGFGLVYIEAMRWGIPVIGSTVDAAPEVNIEGQTGYNIDINQPTTLCQAIVRLLGDLPHARQLGANGRQRWSEQFRFSAFRERFLGHLGEFLQSR